MTDYREAEGRRIGFVDIEIYEDVSCQTWAQARYLVHGLHDVLWTDDLDDALLFLRQSLCNVAQ